jgi:hypothetical protein
MWCDEKRVITSTIRWLGCMNGSACDLRWYPPKPALLTHGLLSFAICHLAAAGGTREWFINVASVLTRTLLAVAPSQRQLQKHAQRNRNEMQPHMWWCRQLKVWKGTCVGRLKISMAAANALAMHATAPVLSLALGAEITSCGRMSDSAFSRHLRRYCKHSASTYARTVKREG